jgi:hypothetical protein
MNRRIGNSLLVLGVAISLGACTTWPKVSEDSQPFAERVARMREGPLQSASVDFPREPEKAKTE